MLKEPCHAVLVPASPHGLKYVNHEGKKKKKEKKREKEEKKKKERQRGKRNSKLDPFSTLVLLPKGIFPIHCEVKCMPAQFITFPTVVRCGEREKHNLPQKCTSVTVIMSLTKFPRHKIKTETSSLRVMHHVTTARGYWK
jgi:hypothetical protein